ncbi:YdeI/OmpD-associated family protein [uncultured Alcanivorax sp.]|uniref:YdeI/OmpD-associated family protein n=1 Tax=Alcanivorax sp. IL2 TaxID=3396310 RepID=UPI00260ED946|nr:YdeI/OmpD-associated family protein [uncultured Alcanivorax sp.]
MKNSTISGGVVHALPDDLRQTLQADPAMLTQWEDITPLARNEWICWIEDAQKADTRRGRITRAQENLTAGKRRPCCWPGCPHRERTGKA